MDIRISKAARMCSTTQRPFEHGEEVVSLLRIENQMLVRHDYAKDTWNQVDGSSAMAVWSYKYVDPRIAEQEPAEKVSPLRKLFYDAVEAGDRESLAKAYLAAQLLRRQKVFRLVKESDEQDGESRIALFTDRYGNRLVEVRDPNLTYAELDLARTTLVRELAELENPEATQADESNGE